VCECGNERGKHVGVQTKSTGTHIKSNFKYITLVCCILCLKYQTLVCKYVAGLPLDIVCTLIEAHMVHNVMPKSRAPTSCDSSSIPFTMNVKIRLSPFEFTTTHKQTASHDSAKVLDGSRPQSLPPMYDEKGTLLSPFNRYTWWTTHGKRQIVEE